MKHSSTPTIGTLDLKATLSNLTLPRGVQHRNDSVYIEMLDGSVRGIREVYLSIVDNQDAIILKPERLEGDTPEPQDDTLAALSDADFLKQYLAMRREGRLRGYIGG